MISCFLPGSAFMSRGAITEVVAKVPKPGVAKKLPKFSFVCFHFPSLAPFAVPKLLVGVSGQLNGMGSYLFF